MSEKQAQMARFLTNLGCRQLRIDKNKFVLDGFDPEFYLLFDCNIDTDDPKPGTCDILVAPPGALNGRESTRLVADCREHHVMRFLFALGVSRFSEDTRKFLYESNGVIRALGASDEVSKR